MILETGLGVGVLEDGDARVAPRSVDVMLKKKKKWGEEVLVRRDLCWHCC